VNYTIWRMFLRGKPIIKAEKNHILVTNRTTCFHGYHEYTPEYKFEKMCMKKILKKINNNTQ
jgi:hypothetical protein